MDSQAKTGEVYLQPHKAGKKWKPMLLSLFPTSSTGVGRLEIKDTGGGGGGGDLSAGVRRHHSPLVDRKLKVVRLTELLSVLRLPPNAEACPMENMSAFCVETQDRTMVFAAFKDDCVEWVEKLSRSMFQAETGPGSNVVHMEENQIYASADGASEFWVVVQRTDAATRCGLQGSYWLQVGQGTLLLRETQKKNVVREWPYELLRRYGRDKLALTIEAGRRCDSGPGTFTFETQQAEKIFSLIQSTIKRKTSPVTLGTPNHEGEKSIPAGPRARSPLPNIPDVNSVAAILENTLKTQNRTSAGLEESAPSAINRVGSSECLSAQPAPITLMPLPQVPTHSSHSRGLLGDRSEADYAYPADCVKSTPKPREAEAVYADPSNYISLKPPVSREPVTGPPSTVTSHPCFDLHHPDSGYSEVFDRIAPIQNEQTITPRKDKTTCHASDEVIYAEPVKEEKGSQKNESKPDPFAHLYAQVCKTKVAPSSSSNSSPSRPSTTVTANMSTATDSSLDEVIYENLGII